MSEHNANVATAQNLAGEIDVYASPHRDILLRRSYAFDQSTRVIHVHLGVPQHSMDSAHAAAIFRGDFGPKFEAEAIRRGILIDVNTADPAREPAWTRFWKSVGRWMRNVTSGGRSAPPTAGSTTD